MADETKDPAQDLVDALNELNEPQAEAEPVEVETTDDVVDTGAVAAEVETPEANDKPAFDKMRQQVQQEISNKLRPVEAKLDALLSRIEEQGRATPAQREQVAALQEKVEAVKDELSDFESADVDLIDPNKAVKALIQRQRKFEAEFRENQRYTDQVLNQTVQAIRPAQDIAYREQWTGWFKANHPDLSDKATDVYAAYETELHSLVDPGEPLPPKTLKRISDAAFQRAVERTRSSPAAATPPATKPTPTKPVTGAQIVPSGAPARRSNASTSKASSFEQAQAELIEALTGGAHDD